MAARIRAIYSTQLPNVYIIYILLCYIQVEDEMFAKERESLASESESESQVAC